MRFRTKTIIAFLGTGLLCIAGVGFVLTRMAEDSLRQAAIREAGGEEGCRFDKLEVSS